MEPAAREQAIAVILPCCEEGAAIGGVVAEFRIALPSAAIYVYDNDSTDDTPARAAAAGATVRTEPRRGKGYVVRRAFDEIDADVYVMADGDGTYDASQAPEMIALLYRERLDMVVGRRRYGAMSAERGGHRLGNRVLNAIFRAMTGARTRDIFSGYRVFSRRYVKSFPALAGGFETETEMSLHAVELALPVREVDTRYARRVRGTTSNLRTVRDGMRIAGYLIYHAALSRPLGPSAALGAVWAGAMLGLGADSGGWGGAGAVAAAGASLWAGLILDAVATRAREHKRALYLRTAREVGVPHGRAVGRPEADVQPPGHVRTRS